jgi:hypothetical protein
MKAKVNVACTLGAEADLFHIAKTVTGLCELEAQNLIALTLRHSSNIGHAAIVLESDGTTAGIDLSDHSGHMQQELSSCDIYFKRCVQPEVLHASNRVRPFGLNYSCRSWRATLQLLKLFGPSDVIRRHTVWKKFLFVPLVKEFEREPTEAASQTILFQARLWDAVDCPGDEQINEDRVSLLLALRQKFGERVVGGLVPTAYAQKHHPSLLTTLPSRQSQYVQWARKHLISIGFRGLFGSLGFKLGEAFAASQCLISEPTAAYLPPDMPLTKYDTTEECLAACDHFLSHSEDAKQRQLLAWKYYQSAVEPGAHMKQLLSAMTGIEFSH